MTGEELLNLADNYFNGTGGIPKNADKGWATLQKAADAGNKQACARYADYAVTRKNYEQAIAYYEQAGVYGNEYFLALTEHVKTAPQKANDYLMNALKNASAAPTPDTPCYLARLYKAAHPSDTENRKKYLTNAAVSGSAILTDEEYSLIGRERGVINSSEEFDKWWNAQNIFSKCGFYKVVKSEETAKSIIEANLEDKKTKKLLGGKVIRMIKKSIPKPVLEYQMVVEQRQLIGKVDIEYSRASSYEGSFERNSDVLCYIPTFRTTHKHKDFYAYSAYGDLCETPDDTRIRITPDRFDELSKEIDRIFIDVKYEQLRVDAHCRIMDSRPSWRADPSVHVNVDKIDVISQDELRTTCNFQPYWFFTWNNGGKTFTIRVDAVRGYVDYLFNNEFGQYKKADNIKEGGCLKSLSEEASGRKMRKFNPIIFLFLFFFTCMVGGILYLLNFIFQNVKYKMENK